MSAEEQRSPERPSLRLVGADDLGDNRPRIPTGRTWRYYVNTYLEHGRINAKFAPKTLAEKERTLGLFLEDFGDLEPDATCAGDLQEWIDSNARGKAKWKSANTRRTKVMQILAMANWHKRKGRLTRNPFEGVEEDYPEGDPREPTSDSVFFAVYRNTDANFRRFLFTMRLQGLRPGNTAGINFEFICWETGLVVLQKHKAKKKTRKPLIIRLVPKVYRLLRWLYDRSPVKCGPVFRTLKGTTWKKEGLDRKWQRLREKLGLPSTATLHGLRHAWGHAMAKKHPIQLVSRGMNHSGSQITEKQYAHLDMMDEEIRRASEDGDPFKRQKSRGFLP